MILLLTGCITPAGMAYTFLSNPEERKMQYINAIRFYLSQTNYPIVFSENSGTDLSNLFEKEIRSGRLEYLFFSGNHNKERGKGFGECEIIQYALDNSRIIKSTNDQYIAKITGRLIIRNIASIIRWHTFFFSHQTVFCAINSDLSFPDSRFIIAPKDFFHSILLLKDKINDNNGYFFEHALYDALKNEKSVSYSPFFIYPQIEGNSGSTGKRYTRKPATPSFIYRYVKYAYLQRQKFISLYRHCN